MPRYTGAFVQKAGAFVRQPDSTFLESIHDGYDQLDDDFAARGRVYYDRAGVRVTRNSLLVDGTRYDVAKLRDLRTIRPNFFSMRSAATAIAGGLAVSAGIWPFSRWASAVLIATVTAVVAALGLARRRGGRFELWAEYDGDDVRLLIVAGSEVYGQVCRALIRAREAGHAPPAPRSSYQTQSP